MKRLIATILAPLVPVKYLAYPQADDRDGKINEVIGWQSTDKVKGHPWHFSDISL